MIKIVIFYQIEILIKKIVCMIMLGDKYTVKWRLNIVDDIIHWSA